MTGEIKPLPANFFSLLVWAKKEGYRKIGCSDILNCTEY